MTKTARLWRQISDSKESPFGMHSASWLLPSVAAGLAGTLFLVWVFGFLFFRYREKHLLLWSWGWGFAALRLAFALALACRPDLGGLILPLQLAVLASGLLLLYGTAAFVRQRLPAWWLAGGGLGAGWILIGYLAHTSFTLQTLPVFFFHALVCSGTGWLFLAAPELDPAGRRVTGWGLCLWGVYTAAYPFLRPLTRLSPWGYLVGALFAFAIAVGMLLVYFEKIHRDLTRSETAHQETASRLSRQGTLLRTLLETIPAPLFYKDAAGLYLGCNEAFSRFLGLPRENIIGRDVYEVAPPELAEVYAQADRELLRHGGTQIYETQVLFADSSRHEVMFHKAVFTGEDGTTAGLVGVMLDISDRKEAEKLLREANRSLQALFRAAPAAILSLDTQNRVTLWNPAAERIFGWPQESILGRPYPLVPTNEQEEHRQILGRVQAGEIIRDQIVRRTDRQGRIIDVSLSGAPLNDEGGNPGGTMFILEDITQSRRAQVALAESEERYRALSEQFRTLLDGITDSLVLLDRELKVVWANEGARLRSKQAPDQMAGQDCYRLWRGRQTPCPECAVQECFASGTPQRHLMEGHDGRILGIKTFPIRNPRGEVVNVIQQASDITEKIRLRKEAEAANRLASLGELAAGVAHEINNPNGLNLLYLPVLQDVFADCDLLFETCREEHGDFRLGGLPFRRVREEMPQMLAEMLDGARRIQRIVEDLKTFARPHEEEGGSFDLNGSVQTAVRLAGNTLKKATANFTVAYADDLPAAWGNAQRIEQVILNLLLNACQALSDPAQAISVATTLDAATEQLLVEIRDEGRGITPEISARLTEPFFTTRRETGGTGLGLSVSNRIVREHHGRLDFLSTPGGGTTVRLALPVPDRK